MSDPIGAAVARAFPGGSGTAGVWGQDTGARAVPVLPVDPARDSFADTLTQAINGVSAQQEHAASTLQAFLRGDDVELHRVMAATEEAQISLEMLIEVRNKFTEAYRTLTSMQG
jgi:flagellar hook-basal body complex protein FliE